MTIAERKKAVRLLMGGASQGHVAKMLCVTQQAVSKLWREELNLGPGKRGGDRCSKRYRSSRKRLLSRKVKAK